jgi:hypothetical protein
VIACRPDLGMVRLGRHELSLHISRDLRVGAAYDPKSIACVTAATPESPAASALNLRVLVAFVPTICRAHASPTFEEIEGIQNDDEDPAQIGNLRVGHGLHERGPASAFHRGRPFVSADHHER